MIKISIIDIGLAVFCLLIVVVSVLEAYRRTQNLATSGAVACILCVTGFLLVTGFDEGSALGRFISSPAAEKFAKRYIEESMVLGSVFYDHPEEEDPFVAKVVSAYRSGGKEGAVKAFSDAQLNLAEKYLPEYIAKSHAYTVVEYSREILSVAKKVARTSPQLCYVFLSGGGEVPKDADLHLSERDLLRISNATNMLFRVSRGNRGRPVDKKARYKALGVVLRRVRNRLGERNFILPSKNLGLDDQSFACLTLIAIMSEILARPRLEAGPLIKALMLSRGQEPAI